MSSHLYEVKVPVYSLGLAVCGLFPGDPKTVYQQQLQRIDLEPREVPLAMSKAWLPSCSAPQPTDRAGNVAAWTLSSPSRAVLSTDWKIFLEAARGPGLTHKNPGGSFHLKS